MKKWHQSALKLIGIAIFVWILTRIDRSQFAEYFTNANWGLLIIAFLLKYLIYFWKTLRWHALVLSTGAKPNLNESWRIYNIGIFLATITPAKLGEFGKAAYLKRFGMPVQTALSIVILDRLADVFVIAMIAIAAAGILFGIDWAFLTALIVLTGAFFGMIIWKKSDATRSKIDWLQFTQILSKPPVLIRIATTTLFGWITYFSWAILVARSLGIEVSGRVLTSSFTFTGILALVPIAPSGLGTRDAALLTLLAPYGVTTEQAVALAFAMFAIIVLSGVVGGAYFLQNQKSE